ncbi:hypothetical protein KFK09_013078 [Dendrobium nobile]|uniref:Uncharacterized protein n=1 Tax=Dendrobium nobile TaxID=94219 RepID=A0A8T3BGY0_DENNO|nr:hypothetical protein KFK09_013078 [Dendrobium nobile]
MRSLRPISNFLRQRSALWAENNLRQVLGVEAARRWFTDQTSSRSAAIITNEIEKIRIEFEGAKQSFGNIPAALRKMPKMNPEGIYVNKNLRLDKIQVYGFDYDYTLAHYSKNLQSLTYDLAKKFLVRELKYPESCLQFEYDPSFPIRGLYFDKMKGCLLKLDFFGSIEPDGCFLGRQKVSRQKIIQIYGSRHIGRDQASGLVRLMDIFCFSENQLPKFLTMLKDKGKKLFLLTNSPYCFVDGGMRFLLEDTGVYRDSWRDIFDVVIACANKPTFYTSEHPFRYYNIEKDTLAFTAVEEFLPGQVYYHGCLKSFLQITKWNGPEAKFHTIQELLGKFHMVMPRCDEQTSLSLLDELNDERIHCRCMMRNMFNTFFGATFLADSGQESAFSYHIHHYADVYTSKPENFLLYSPEAWLHVPFDIKIMPHHVKVPSSLFKQQ